LHPLASASCEIVTTVTTTTPSNASAATIAIIAIDVVVGIPSCDEWFMSNANPEYAIKHSTCLYYKKTHMEKYHIRYFPKIANGLPSSPVESIIIRWIQLLDMFLVKLVAICC
jgi:hypothetical protein